jgi:selenocysteine lyase/cysteine desulfurase
VITAKARGEGFYLKPDQEGFEDGTLSYLTIPAVEIGLKHIENIGIDMIHERVSCLTGWLLENLLALRHSNGMPVMRIYGPTTPEKRGGTIAFNVYDPAEKQFDCYMVQEKQNAYTGKPCAPRVKPCIKWLSVLI